MALKQLTGLLGIDRSSVFRLANTLRQRRFLANPDGRKEYILGPSVWRLSRKYGRNVLIAFCREHLRTLSSDDGRDGAPRGRDGAKALFHRLPRGDRAGADRLRARPASSCRCYATAHGKALLADFDLHGARGALRRAGRCTPYTKRTTDDARRAGARLRPHRARAATRPTTASSSKDCAAWPRRFATRTASSSPRSVSPRRRAAFRRPLYRRPRQAGRGHRAGHQRVARRLTRDRALAASDSCP